MDDFQSMSFVVADLPSLLAQGIAVCSASTRAEALHSSALCVRLARDRRSASPRSPRAQGHHGRSTTHGETVREVRWVEGASGGGPILGLQAALTAGVCSPCLLVEPEDIWIPPFMRTPQGVQLRDCSVLFQTAGVPCCSRYADRATYGTAPPSPLASSGLS
jgi:hypothetical protein